MSSKSSATDAGRVHACLDALSSAFVARRALLDIVMLGVIAREHVLLIGPPGTGKSAAVRALAQALDARVFDYLVGRFTEPAELFGALDLAALREGRVQPVTAGMLPEAEIAFLDEIFLGSTAILNTLLKLLNERTYSRGAFSMPARLLSCVGASNALPDDPALSAFADRFLMTMFVEPVADSDLETLLAAGWRSMQAGAAAPPPLDRGLLDRLHAALLAVDIGPAAAGIAQVSRKLRLMGAPLSDRKLVKGQKLVAAAAVLRGVSAAGSADLWPLTYLVPDAARQAEARDWLQAELGESRNPVLHGSAAAAVSGLTAHGQALAEAAERLLAERPAAAPDGGPDMALEPWLVRLETLLVRIDAAFAPGALPAHLRPLRERIDAVLEAESARPRASAG